MNRRPDHLTEREEEILRCIRRWIEERVEGPSVRQLAKAIGTCSTASVTYHLANLERSGALIRDGRGWNTCRLGHTAVLVVELALRWLNGRVRFRCGVAVSWLGGRGRCVVVGRGRAG
ncbi:LexA family protein [Streptomyces sp. NPDC000994]